MARIENTEVRFMSKSLKASRYPMAVELGDLSDDLTERQLKLANAPSGSGHDNFLKGIVVEFDLTLSIKAWVQAERYHFLEFVSSQSTMHRIARMDVRKSCNKYVTADAIANVEGLKDEYNRTHSPEDYLRLLYNIPTGFEITAGMVTNYSQLKTIYNQRRCHRLPDWQMFCDWIETLPNSQLITGKAQL